MLLCRFDMPAPTMTPELKKDLQLLKVRSFWLAYIIVLSLVIYDVCVNIFVLLW